MIETLAAIAMLASGATVQAPPAHYDYPATNMEVHYDGPAFVSVYCQKVDAQACAFTETDDDGRIVKCIVLLPYGADEDSALYRHEQAHCNGWHEDHPLD